MQAREKTEATELAVSSATLDLVTRGEYDVQIATAHKYPRDVGVFRRAALDLAIGSQAVAQECNYSLPRKDKKTGQTKTIEGASIRFAEIIGSTWGNAHVGTRIIADDGEFITAQAAFHDLERNWKVIEEVQRRVTDSNGRRYSADMIAVTANAARSIAMRNAILHGIPKAFWEDIRLKARSVAIGDQRSIASKRMEAVKAFAPFGVTEAQILALLGRGAVDDITIEDLGTLFGVLTGIKDGDITPEEAFAGEHVGATKTEAVARMLGARMPAPPAPPPVESAEAAAAELPLEPAPASTRALTFAEVADLIAGGVVEDECHVAIERVRDPAHRKELRALLAKREQPEPAA